MVRVLVVGSIHMDLVVVLDRFPEIGETVIGRDFKMTPGGKGANQAVAAARLGAETYMVGRLGRDFFGRVLRENLKRNGVRDDFVVEDPESYTGVALIFVDVEGRNMIAVAPGTDARVGPSDVDSALDTLGSVDAVLLQLEIPLETVTYAAKRAKEAGALVVLNPAPFRPLPEDVYRHVDVLTPNEVEARQLAGRFGEYATLRECCEVLLEKGLSAVVVTLGPKGAHVFSRDFEGLVPAFKVPVVDTTGAGDAFSAALAVALSEGMSIEKAVVFANAVAAIKTTRLGAQEGLPYREEVNKFLSERGVRVG